jgi:hypothetical protein
MPGVFRNRAADLVRLAAFGFRYENRERGEAHAGYAAALLAVDFPVEGECLRLAIGSCNRTFVFQFWFAMFDYEPATGGLRGVVPSRFRYIENPSSAHVRYIGGTENRCGDNGQGEKPSHTGIRRSSDVKASEMITAKTFLYEVFVEDESSPDSLLAHHRKTRAVD